MTSERPRLHEAMFVGAGGAAAEALSWSPKAILRARHLGCGLVGVLLLCVSLCASNNDVRIQDKEWLQQ